MLTRSFRCAPAPPPRAAAAANLGNANLMPTARKRFQEKLMSRLEALEAQVSDILMFARSNDVTVSELDAQSLLTARASRWPLG